MMMIIIIILDAYRCPAIPPKYADDRCYYADDLLLRGRPL